MGFGLLGAGVVIVYFSHGGRFGAVGIACILIGSAIGLIGTARFRNMNQRISLVQKQCGMNVKREKD